MVSFARQRTGRQAYLAGLSAEDQVARRYETMGYHIAARRWRGQGGEVDLIAAGAEGLVFIEVKKSRSFEQAAARLTNRQMQRLQMTALEYLGTQPQGLLTDMRFDVALVDSMGDIRVIENAIGF
jgi:putative endonuclease